MKEMATHYSIRAWRIPWTREVWWATVHGVDRSQTRLSDFYSPSLNLWNTKYLGEEKVFKEHILQVILVGGAWLKAG